LGERRPEMAGKRMQPLGVYTLSLLLTLGLSVILAAEEESQPLLLQEMSWMDVQNYLKANDMVIIPLGSTEQHGPHLPLGTDSYIGLKVTEMISARTGVVVAPVLWSGYSVYHSGFPGTLSLKPETMEQVLFETAEMLIKYGFRKVMLANFHGGNRVVENNVIHRINHTTEATAVSIGIGSPVQKGGGEDETFFDNHAGLSETSWMLFVRPDLVKMERAEKPKIKFTAQMQKLLEEGKTYPDLMMIFNSQLAVPEDTKKKGASHEISSNGIWSFEDPREATEERGEKAAEYMVRDAVNFINAWKRIKGN
jgi:creatinine amidohydrolase